MIWTLISIIFAYITWNIFQKSPSPISGVYLQKGKWYPLKFSFIYVMLMVRKFRNRNLTEHNRSNVGYGVKSKNCDEEMENVQALADHPLAIDAVYFNGANKRGNYIVIATARRPKSAINGIFLLKIPELGILEMPSFPDTTVFSNDEKFSTPEINITPIKAMKEWNLKYEGKARLHGTDEIYTCKLNATWKASTEYFDFDTDMHPVPLCNAISRHPWSKTYFDKLKSAHQTHYEQFGVIDCEYSVSAESTSYSNKIEMSGFRDHSYGKYRDWKELHRYALHMFTLEDGSSVSVGVLCQPKMLSWLQLGYINTPNGQKHSVSSVSLPLYDLSENGNPPKNYSFSYVAGGQKYNVEVQVLNEPLFYIGNEWEAEIHERFSIFSVNGVKGWGIAEWMYSYKNGRPDYITKQVENRKAEPFSK